MKILFMNGQTHLPEEFGGIQRSADQLCRHLLNRGHKISVLARFFGKGIFGWKCKLQKKILRRKVSRDTVLGYPVWRAWSPWDEVEYVVDKEKPDAIVVMTGWAVRMALAVRPTGIPVIMSLQVADFDYHGGPFEDLGNVPCVANSGFTAEKYHGAYNINPHVIYPFISLDDYKIKTTKENVTFINPVPQKGLDIALKIARLCPEIPFSFVEGWTLGIADRRELIQKLSALPNVTLSPSQKKMRKVYGRCKILLAPSVWEEAYGRVATEAQVSGIPVVASMRGGLPESVGPGGILIDPDGPIEEWAKAIRRLWQDDAYYAELSAAALRHAQRPENSLSYKIDMWEKVLLAVTSGQKITTQ